MVATQSMMNELGGKLPQFELPNVSANNQFISSPMFSGKPLLVMFICNHCPYVLHIISELTTLANTVQSNGFKVVAISSNDATSYPQDGPDAMSDFAKQQGFEFPYCFDESQEVAKQFSAACTPDFFVYDDTHRLCYRGQMDDSRPKNNSLITGYDLRTALEKIQQGKRIDTEQKPSMGCNIKWRDGNAPDYFP